MTSTLFAPVVETLDASQAGTPALFGSDGMAKKASFAAGMMHPRIGGDPRKYKMAMYEAEELVGDVIAGRRPIWRFTEAMTTDLFPLVHADSLDRQMYGAYSAAPVSWSRYARRGKVNDFREVKRFANTGIRGLLKIVPELAEHERRTTEEAVYKYSVNKYEAGFGMSFELMVNDDLDQFARLPQDLAQSAIDTEENFVATLIAGPSGPNATYYNLANDNVATSNAPLTRGSLQDALTRLLKRKDERGNPITVSAVELVVAPGLMMTANEIIGATQYRIVGDNGNVTIISGNGVAVNLTLSVNYQIGAVATTANADTSWWLFANPGSARPALEVGFLRGYEQPALYEKIPDMRRFGGGAEVAWSFEHGDAHKKVQHVLGGSFVDAKMTIASRGDGSTVS
ncbi:MAG TPA: hypothetical protein VF657_15240 [Actinoplanes sp.]|jgi:hypothetical protein